ncbi:MAG: DUF1269 domain-containing protein [Caldilinea sp.]
MSCINHVTALFLLSANAVQDRVMAEFQVVNMELIASNLTAEQEATLREEFGA